MYANLPMHPRTQPQQQLLSTWIQSLIRFKKSSKDKSLAKLGQVDLGMIIPMELLYLSTRLKTNLGMTHFLKFDFHQNEAMS